MAQELISLGQAEQRLERRLASLRRKSAAELTRGAAKELETAKTLFARGIEHIRKAGDRLLALKRIVGHGQWQASLDEIGISQQAASNYMRISKAWAALPPAQPDGEPWTINAAITRIRMMENEEEGRGFAGDLDELPPVESDKALSRPRKGRGGLSHVARLRQKSARLEEDLAAAVYEDAAVIEIVVEHRNALTALLKRHAKGERADEIQELLDETDTDAAGSDDIERSLDEADDFMDEVLRLLHDRGLSAGDLLDREETLNPAPEAE